VIERPGHTEAAVDLARLAGLRPAGVICEIADGAGTMLRGERLRRFSSRHGLVQVSIDELRDYMT
jgi:3,4-dihydroxy 2-butanone 4-phosphate synthase/GTP cyclohydrolase II